LSPLFVFNNITPAATVDEGNNWINLSYGPLAFVQQRGAVDGGPPGRTQMIAGAYSIGAASNAVNGGPPTTVHPPLDFFGNPRPAAQGNAADIRCGGVPARQASTDRPWSR